MKGHLVDQRLSFLLHVVNQYDVHYNWCDLCCSNDRTIKMAKLSLYFVISDSFSRMNVFFYEAWTAIHWLPMCLHIHDLIFAGAVDDRH